MHARGLGTMQTVNEKMETVWWSAGVSQVVFFIVWFSFRIFFFANLTEHLKYTFYCDAVLLSIEKQFK